MATLMSEISTHNGEEGDLRQVERKSNDSKKHEEIRRKRALEHRRVKLRGKREKKKEQTRAAAR